MGFVDDVARLRRVQPGAVRMGTVVSIPTPAEALAMVLLAGGEVPAYFTSDHLWFDPGTGPQSTVAVGVKVTLLRLDGSWQIVATHSGSGGLMGGPVLGTELLPNSGFEFGSGTAPDHWSFWPWVSGDVTYARDLTPGESVSGSARLLVGLNPGTDTPFVNAWSEAVRVDPGETYQVQAWVKASTIEASLVVDTYVLAGDSAANTQPFTSATTLTGATVTAPGAAYQLLPASVVIPTGKTYARVFLRASAATTTAALTVSWDEASLRQRITA